MIAGGNHTMIMGGSKSRMRSLSKKLRFYKNIGAMATSTREKMAADVFGPMKGIGPYEKP